MFNFSALTTDDEKRQVSNLVSSFLRQVNFFRDFESELEFYAESRAAFSNLDPVLENLVQVSKLIYLILIVYMLKHIL